ncbi:MAG: hypothetical protein QXI58_07155 [Candidatus Micrarchaeia archaeon]
MGRLTSVLTECRSRPMFTGKNSNSTQKINIRIFLSKNLKPPEDFFSALSGGQFG